MPTLRLGKFFPLFAPARGLAPSLDIRRREAYSLGMRIHLNEIPDEGKSWHCNRKTSELNAALEDLIQDSPYQIDFTILPMQAGTYDISGQLQASYTDACSACGEDIKIGLQKTFRDLLMPVLDEPRNSHYAKSNHVSDLLNDGPEVFNYEGNTFLADEYFHEKIGLEQSLVPKCAECSKKAPKDALIYDEQMEPVRKSPFAGLKDLKLT